MVSKSDCMEWLKKRTPLEKTLLSLSSLLLLTLLLLVLVGIAFKGKSSNNSSHHQEGCWTRDCIAIAGGVLANMDTEVDSCTDFYSLGCGRYRSLQSHASAVAKEATNAAYFALKSLLESPETSQLDDFEDLKSFYNSCVRFGSYRPKGGATSSALLDLMKKMGIGVWPILDPLYDTSAFSLEHTLVSLVLLDVPVVFSMQVVPDQQIEGSYLIKISPGGPRESGRPPSEIRSDVHLMSSVLSSLLLLGVSAANTKNDVNDILSVDSSFAAIEQDQSDPCDFNTLAPEEAVSELNRIIPEINWAYVLAEIRRATGMLRSNFAVHLFCKHKIRDYVVHLNDLSLRSETNYLGWRFFSKFVEHIIPSFEKFRFGQEEPSPRWRVCVELLEKFASPVLTKALTVNMIGKETHRQVEKIANATLTTTRQLVNRAMWLDDQQKTKLRKKVSLLRIRYPFYNSKEHKMDSQVNMYQVDVNNFTSTIINLERQWVIRRFKRLVQDEQAANSWVPLISPPDESTFSDFAVPIYFDQFQSPFLREHGSQWMNFGGFGVAVARHISRILMSFDMGASASDGLKLLNVWVKEQKSSMCFLRSFTTRYGMEIKSLSPHVVEDFTRHLFIERSAIEIAYETCRSSAESSGSLPGLDWSDQKMFFLALTQSLCDVDQTGEAQRDSFNLKRRLNSALSSYRPFNEAFGCTSSSPPCQIWT